MEDRIANAREEIYSVKEWGDILQSMRSIKASSRITLVHIEDTSTSLARGLETFISARSTSPAVNEEANDGSRYDFIYMSMRMILIIY